LQLHNCVITHLNCAIDFNCRNRQADSLTGFPVYVKTAIGGCCLGNGVYLHIIVIAT
jgi:hypothetical protein